MLWLENLVRALSPAIILEGSSWRDEWEDSQRTIFLRIMRVFLPLIAVAYVLHYYLFDKPFGLEPLEAWFTFRMAAAGILMATLFFYLSPLVKVRWYKAPAIVVTGLVCYSQAQVTLYYPDAPWVYPFVFVLASCLMLRLDAFRSIAYSAAVVGSFFPTLLDAGISPGPLVSATVVILVVVGAMRTSYSFEVSNFLLNKKNAEQQQAVLELQREFSDRIKSFIPKVIANRIQQQVDKSHTSVLEASLNVLQPEKRNVACLFSDIRGFTQGSKDLDEFINESVIPEVKATSADVETYEGIPRKIGDLIFAYFDSKFVELNILRALLAGIKISVNNRAINETVSKVEIKRYVLISSGPAIVGNLGGIDSSVEITALGSPVNFLSRLDDATKNVELAKKLEPGDIVVCDDSYKTLIKVCPSLSSSEVELAALGVKIRDFPEVSRVHIVKPSSRTFDYLAEVVKELENDPRFVSLAS